MSELRPDIVTFRISTAVSAITCEAGAKSRRILQESRFTSNGYVTDKEKSFAVASQAMHFKVNSNTIRLINSVLKRFFWDAKEVSALSGVCGLWR
jgi:hypothetical protein